MKSDKRNIDNVVSYLNRAFSIATHKAASKIGKDNSKGTQLYDFQVDFCYMIDSIQRDPPHTHQDTIRRANELIEKIENL